MDAVKPGAYNVQDVADVQPYRANFEFSLHRTRSIDTDYAQGVRVRPDTPTGFEYEATTAGRPGFRKFQWPETVGATVNDGSVVWTARALSTASLVSTLSSVEWSADTGITVTPGGVVGMVALATVAGGVAGRVYEVRCKGTMADGSERMLRCQVEVTKKPGVNLA